MTTSYNVLTILITVLFFYFITFTLTKIKKIKITTHRKIWNYILLFSFLFSCILGLVIATILDLKIYTPLYLNILWVHVELGIVMTTISIFHILWHLKYYFYIKPKS